MKGLNLILLLLFFSLLSSGLLPAETYQAEIENLSNRNYFNAVLNAIQNADGSIIIAIYLISFDPKKTEGQSPSPVKQLLDSLILAKNRGVKVKIILEYHSERDFTPEGLNYNSYHYLKNNGVNVSFDKSSTRCLHEKTIVIDKEIIITGSSNWSIPAFISSDETNILIKSKPLAQEILKSIEEIPVREEPALDNKTSFAVPLSFCSSSSGRLKKIIAANDERCLDILLILWANNKNTVSCNFMAQALGLSEKMGKCSYRRQIKKVLKKLEQRYGLIALSSPQSAAADGDSRAVIKYTWPAGKDNIEIELRDYPGGQPIKFPKDYFAYEWNKRLSLSAKAVLITMYAELQEVNPVRNSQKAASNGVNNAVTCLPISYLSKKYGMKLFTYSKGIQELKRYNIIKIQYSPGQKERAPTRITILGVYNMNEYNANIKQLRAQYGKEKTEEAQTLADIISGRYDIALIKDILIQENYYGIENVRYAFDIIAKKSPDSHKRTYKYVIGILKNIRKNT